MDIIDVETHLLHPASWDASYARGNDEFVQKYIHEHPDFDQLTGRMGVEALLASMDANGIQRAIVIGLAWRDSARQQENNDYVAESARAHPERLAGLYVPHVANPTEAAQQLEQLDASVFVGAKLIPKWQGIQMDDPALDPMLDVLVAQGLPLMVHVDHVTQSLDGDTPFRLLALARRRPDLTILAAHLGGLLCLYRLLPTIREELRNMYFVTSVSATMEMVAFAAQVDPHNLLFGTDHPFNHCHDQTTPLDALRALGLSEEHQRMILAGNARRLFGWEEG